MANASSGALADTVELAPVAEGHTAVVQQRRDAGPFCPMPKSGRGPSSCALAACVGAAAAGRAARLHGGTWCSLADEGTHTAHLAGAGPIRCRLPWRPSAIRPGLLIHGPQKPPARSLTTACAAPRWMRGATVGARVTGSRPCSWGGRYCCRPPSPRRYCQWLHVTHDVSLIHTAALGFKRQLAAEG